MTPRHADIAFVLESVEGVGAVYAIEQGKRASKYFDAAVSLAQGGRVLAEVHYALLRVMTHEGCARVFLFHTAPPPIIAEAARPLLLSEPDREAARRRVPPPPPREAISAAAWMPASDPAVLIVDDDDDVQRVVSEVLEDPARWVVAPTLAAAIELTAERSFDLVLCDAQRAFGLDGLLARLPLDVASHVLVLAKPSDVANARWRLQGTKRILSKPLEAWLLRERLARAGAVSLLWAPDLQKAAAAERPHRSLSTPSPAAPFSVLLADVDEDVHEVLRRIFREEARHVMRRDPEDAAELALSAPFHVIVCGAKAALHPRSFLDGIAREDAIGADGVIVIAAARDVPYVRHRLEEMGRKNRVLAAPVDDALLLQQIFRDHPSLAARLAVADVADGAPAKFAQPRFRRAAALIVDDDQTTRILFSAAHPHDGADVALATTPMEAFEHVTSRAVDVLLVSATMRGDGGEPFYRVLWRLVPELKGRTVLVVSPEVAPPSAPVSQPPRMLQRPLTREAVGRVLQAFTLR